MMEIFRILKTRLQHLWQSKSAAVTLHKTILLHIFTTNFPSVQPK